MTFAVGTPLSDVVGEKPMRIGPRVSALGLFSPPAQGKPGSTGLTGAFTRAVENKISAPPPAPQGRPTTSSPPVYRR